MPHRQSNGRRPRKDTPRIEAFHVQTMGILPAGRLWIVAMEIEPVVLCRNPHLEEHRGIKHILVPSDSASQYVPTPPNGSITLGELSMAIELS